MDSNLDKQKRSLRSLCSGEFVACLSFILCLYMLSYRNIFVIDYAIIYPFTSLLLILLQGSYYWYYKLCIIKDKNPERKIFRKIYRTFNILDMVMFALYPLGLIFLLLVSDISIFRRETYFGVFLFVFGIIEYVNYFHVRLSYSKHEDIVALFKFENTKKSSLFKELKK